MEIKIACTNPACQQHIALDESMRGHSVKCPTCGTSFKVPAAPPKPTPPPAKPTKGSGGANKAVVWGILGALFVAAAGWTTIHLWKRHQQAKALAEKRALAARIGRSATALPSWASNAPYVAANTGDLEQLKKMLDQKPEILNQGIGSAYSTLLHTAAYNGRANIVEELLRRKANVNARNRFEHTPLYDCVDHRGTKEIAILLLDAGADVNIADSAGKTPLKVAMEKNRTELADLLRQHGAKE